MAFDREKWLAHTGWWLIEFFAPYSCRKVIYGTRAQAIGTIVASYTVGDTHYLRPASEAEAAKLARDSDEYDTEPTTGTSVPDYLVPDDIREVVALDSSRARIEAAKWMKRMYAPMKPPKEAPKRCQNGHTFEDASGVQECGECGFIKSPNGPFKLVHTEDRPDDVEPATLYAIGEGGHLHFLVMLCPCTVREVLSAGCPLPL